MTHVAWAATEWAAPVIAVAVGVGMVMLAVGDARTAKVPVRPARALSALAVVGLGVVGLVDQAWLPLAQAAAGAALVTAIQLVPYLGQSRSDKSWIGRADVRLGIPFGWTLGWFGIGFTVVGFLTALLSGLVVSVATRRRRIPFIPFLSLGFWVGLIWAALARG